MSLFKFKQFDINHHPNVFKVGTDAVLLGACIPLDNSKTILDVGTGSGIIALMLAQRFSSAQIHAIDSGIDQINCAKKNFHSSPFSDRIFAEQHSISTYIPRTKFDLIASNPPYFEHALKPHSQVNRTSKHILNMNLYEWINHCMSILNSKGKAYFILPFDKAEELNEAFSKEAWNTFFKLNAHSFAGELPKRQIIGLSKQPYPIEEKTLIIYDSPRNYSLAYQKLTQAYHPFL